MPLTDRNWPAIAVGAQARAALDVHRHWRILSTHASAVWLGADSDCIAVVARDSYDGPLQLRVDTGTRVFARIDPDAKAQVVCGRYLCLDPLGIDFGLASTWLPGSGAIGQGAGDVLAVELECRDKPETGLARLLNAPEESDAGVLRRARQAVDAICAAMQQRRLPPEKAIAGLLGLGPGMTPSGDDWLGGFIVGLKRQASPVATDVDALGTILLRLAPHRTNAISGALLRCAVQGSAIAPVTELLSVLDQSDPLALSVAVDRCIAVGHTSGWDTLAGLVAGLGLCLDEAGN